MKKREGRLLEKRKVEMSIGMDKNRTKNKTKRSEMKGVGETMKEIGKRNGM